MTGLAVSDLQASLGGRPVLKGVTVAVAGGEFVGLIGPNGAGKTTLLRAILGLTPATGSVTIAGRDAHALPAADRARKVSYMPQEREIAWPVTVRRLVSLGRTPHRAPFAALSDKDDAAVEAAMTRMDIRTLADRPATELSGGERARVLVARALAQEAGLMLADEPTAGLDPEHQIALMRIFVGLAEEGRSVVASLHDLSLAARWCSRLVLLDGGRIVADGPPREVLTAERLRAVYRIETHIMENAGSLIIQPTDIREGSGRPGSLPD